MSAIMAVRCAATQAPGSQVIASSRGEQVFQRSKIVSDDLKNIQACAVVLFSIARVTQFRQLP